MRIISLLLATLVCVAAAGAQEPPSAPGEVFRDCEECPEMVVIPAGAQAVGAPFDAAPQNWDDVRLRTVRINVPIQGAVEVVRRDWTLCVAEGVCPALAAAGADDDPVEDVRWDDAVSYVAWLSFRTDKLYNLYTDPDASLRRMVPVPAFAVGRFEVTWDEWNACETAGGCRRARGGDEGWGLGRRPVVNVSWEEAKEYVAWLSERTGETYRLLSDIEWEYAARAGSAAEYAWGPEAPTCETDAKNGVSHVSCGVEGTREVGAFQPNAFGLYDVHGNVGEWTEDCAVAQRPSPELTRDRLPSTTIRCDMRVKRGGNWFFETEVMGFGTWAWSNADDRSWIDGFRVAREL